MGSRMFSKAHLKALKPSIQNNFTLKHPLNMFRAQSLLNIIQRLLVQKFVPGQGGLLRAATEHVRARCACLLGFAHSGNTSPSFWQMPYQTRKPPTDYTSPLSGSGESFPAPTFKMNPMSN